MTPERVLQHSPLVLDPRQRKRYFEDGLLVVPGLRRRPVARSAARRGGREDRRVARTHRLRRSIRSRAGSLRGKAEHPAAPQGHRSTSRAVDVRHRSVGRRSRRRPARPRRALPQLEAQLQMVRGRRARPLAPGHPGVAAHELQCADLRRLSRRHGSRAGTAHGDPGHTSRSALRPVRRRRPVDGRRHGARRRLLLNVYASADALPFSPAPAPTSKTGVLVRGVEPAHVHMEPYPAKLPPRWDQVGYRSIFAAQSSRAAYAD